MVRTVGITEDTTEWKRYEEYLILARQAAPQPEAASLAALKLCPYPCRSCPGTAAEDVLAEDNPTNRMVALAQLGKLGCKTDAVENGAEAVAAMHFGEYDVVLIDCQMPVMEGYEPIERIRALGNTEIPIVAVMAHAMQADRDKCMQVGMNDFVSKRWTSVVWRKCRPGGVVVSRFRISASGSRKGPS